MNHRKGEVPEGPTFHIPNSPQLEICLLRTCHMIALLLPSFELHHDTLLLLLFCHFYPGLNLQNYLYSLLIPCLSNITACSAQTFYVPRNVSFSTPPTLDKKYVHYFNYLPSVSFPSLKKFSTDF